LSNSQSKNKRAGRVHPLTKVIALVLCLCMLAFDIAYAAPTLSAPQTPAIIPEIPSQLGNLDEFHPGTVSRTIFYIQDAHDSIEAQEKIAALIRHLVESQDIKTVFEEGYEGPVPSDDYFGHLRDAETREKVSRVLLDKLAIGGAEYAHINRTSDYRLIGADRVDLHLENIEWYREAALRQNAIENDLKALEKHLRKLTDKFFPKELKEWMVWKKRLDAEKMDLLDYLKRLAALNPGAADKLLAGGSDLAYLIGAADIRESAAQKRLEAVDAKALFTEIEAFENAVAESFLDRPRDRDIFRNYKILQSLGRLNRLEISFAEYQAVRPVLESEPTRRLADFTARHSGQSLVVSRQWERNIRHALKFYELAEARDEAIRDALVSWSRDKGPDERSAVLVFGGFHRENIKKILQNEGWSYAVISPNLGAADESHARLYRNLMASGVRFMKAAATASRYYPIYVPGELYGRRHEIRAMIDRTAAKLGYPEASREELRMLTKPSALEVTAEPLRYSKDPYELWGENQRAVSAWRTGLWDLEGVKQAYLEYLRDDRVLTAVNSYRLEASIAALSDAEKTAFEEWGKSLPKKNGWITTAEVLKWSRGQVYKPACELWESLHSFIDRGIWDFQEEFRKTTDGLGKIREEMFRVINRHEAHVHGTGNDGTADASWLVPSPVLRYHWSLLNIMLENRLVTHFGIGYMRGVWGFSGPYDAVAYGPYFVVFKRSVPLFDGSDLKTRFDSPGYLRVAGSEHAIYLVPRALDAEFLRRGIEKALEFGILKTPEEARILHDKVMTYEELVTHEAFLDRILEGEMTPAQAMALAKDEKGPQDRRSELRGGEDFSNLGLKQPYLDDSLEAIRALSRTVYVDWIIPMYDEAGRIEKEDALRLKVIQLEVLRRRNPNFQWRIIAVDDATPGLASKNAVDKLIPVLAAEFPGAEIEKRIITDAVPAEEKTGPKGGAVLKGFRIAKDLGGADFIGYTDLDVSTNLFQT